MKNILYIFLLALPLGLFAQVTGLYVGPGETVTALEGTPYFFGGVVVADNTGTLDIQASGAQTNVVINGEVTGDDRISFGDETVLDIQNCTLDFSWDAPAENNEVLRLLLISSTALANVPPGNSLTMSGDLALAGPGTRLVLQADASGYGQLLTLGAITNVSSAEIEAQQYLTSVGTEGWRQLAFPVSATLGQLEDDLTLVNASNGSNPEQYNVFYYDAEAVAGSGGSGLNANANTSTTFSEANAKHWTDAPGTFDGNPLTETNTTAIGPGNNARAYNFYTGGLLPALDATTPGQIDITGTTVGNATYTFDCYTTHDVIFKPGETPVSVDQNLITGWNLIPNPYPSNIDVSELLNNPFFTGTNAYAAVHVWDPANEGTDLSPSGLPAELQQYVAITNDGLFSHVNWNTGNGLDNTGAYIAPFQAFWVKTERTPTTGSLGVTKTLTVENDDRTVTRGNNYFKNTPPLIRLNVFDMGGDAYRDQAVIAFDPSSTKEIDANDAFKFTSPNEWVPSLYTTSDGSPMTINRLPNPNPSYSIPLHMDSKKNGEPYQMAMVEENIDPSWSIYLEDVKLGTMHNLRLGEYEFRHDASMKTNRFVVHINKVPNHLDPNSWNNVNVFGNADGINVAFVNPDVSTADIIISNLAGQLVYQGKVSTGRTFTYPIQDDIAVYAIQVVTGKKVTNEKVVR